MKRTLSTIVLFVLLILTVVALTQIKPSTTSALKLDSASTVSRRAN
jgi:hypothetical protein